MIKLPIKLHKDEEVLAVVRQSLVVHWPKIILALLWILLPCLFLFPLLQWGPVGLVVFLLVFMSGLLYGIRGYIVWRGTILIVTDRRVVDVWQKSFTGREIVELAIDEITDIVVRRTGLICTLFGLGQIRMETAKDKKFDLEMCYLAEPEKIQNLLFDVHYLQKQ